MARHLNRLLITLVLLVGMAASTGGVAHARKVTSQDQGRPTATGLKPWVGRFAGEPDGSHNGPTPTAPARYGARQVRPDDGPSVPASSGLGSLPWISRVWAAFHLGVR